MIENTTSPIPILGKTRSGSAELANDVGTTAGGASQRLAAIASIVKCVGSGSYDIPGLQHSVSVIRTSLNASDVVLFKDNGEGTLEAIVSCSDGGDVPREWTRLPLGDPIIRRVVAARTPLLLPAHDGDTDVLDLGDAAPRPSQQFVAPLLNAGSLLGLLVINCNDGRTIGADDLSQVEIFAGQLGCCLQQVHLRSSLAQAEVNLRDQFMRAEKMRTMGEMASGVFHDFNNILGAVVGRVQLIHYKTKDEDVKRALSQIERIALQGAETVKRLQEFSRLHQQREVGPTDLNRVIDDALEVTRHRWESEAQKRGVSYNIERRLAQDIVVPGVHAQLVDAVANLIRNALDAMEAGGRISFETTRSGDVCRLAVRDEGRGMGPEEVEKVFAPFYTTKGAQGTGLGMTVVQDIVRAHDGVISIESQPRKGTTFRIELPVYKDAAAPPAEGEEQTSTESLRLLIVDDDHIILDVVSEALQDAGHKVDSFSHGSDAINALEKNAYDAVVTDLGMPDVTGWEVARAAKLHKANLPVIVISGWGAQFAEEQLTDSGVDAMLAKPFHLQLLRETIERLAKGDTKGIPAVRP